MNKIIIIIIIIVIFIYFFKPNIHEGYNSQSGQFCQDCNSRPFNTCLQCFNCGICVNKYGDYKCVPGDYKGPYNMERCVYWYNRDPFTTKPKPYYCDKY